MNHSWPGVFLPLIFCSVSLSQNAPGSVPPPIPFPPRTAPMPPLPPDTPVPDAGTVKKIETSQPSLVKKTVNKLTPVCMDIVFHTCVGPPETSAPDTRSEANKQFEKNFEVGETYFHDKNYRAAESRFREALEYMPGHPEATYKLAASLDQLGRNDEAVEVYHAYLRLAPAGRFAERVAKRLKEMAAGKASTP